MRRCVRCLYPTSKPDLFFNEQGVCSACVAHEKRKEIDWDERKKELVRILENAPKNGSGYDVIVPSSGGKDSHWQVLTLIELGARPLVVTATTCHLTPIGRANIDNLARYATTIEVSPNKTVRAKLNRLGLELVGDISWPEHVSIFTTPFKVACDLGIPLIFYGENPQNQYGGPPGTEQAKEMTRRWVTEFGGFLGMRPSDMIGLEGITAQDMQDYMPPSAERLDRVGVTAYFLGQFLPWDSHENARVAKEAGMKQERPSDANWWHAENLDNLDTFWHDHGMYRKFGYGRLCAQICVDIREGLIDRSQAEQIVRERDGLMAEKYMGLSVWDSMRRIGVDKDHAMKILDRFTTWDLFSRVENGRPILKDFS